MKLNKLKIFILILSLILLSSCTKKNNDIEESTSNGNINIEEESNDSSNDSSIELNDDKDKELSENTDNKEKEENIDNIESKDEQDEESSNSDVNQYNILSNLIKDNSNTNILSYSKDNKIISIIEKQSLIIYEFKIEETINNITIIISITIDNRDLSIYESNVSFNKNSYRYGYSFDLDSNFSSESVINDIYDINEIGRNNDINKEELKELVPSLINDLFILLNSIFREYNLNINLSDFGFTNYR